MKNERGLITVDFLFAMVLMMGLSSLLFVMTFTLSVASVVQYVTYSAARTYGVAHIDKAAQEERGQAKYRELIENPVFQPLFSGGWFQISATPNVGDHTAIIPGYVEAADEKNQFWGVGTDFIARILDFQIPFYGSTNPDGDGKGSGFKTYMASYLGREPTTAECIEFTQGRWEAIRNLSVSNGVPYGTGTGSTGYFPMTDDGC